MDKNNASEYGILYLFFGLLAYMMENEEPIAVRKDTIDNLILNSEGRVPHLIIQEAENGTQVKFGTILMNVEEENE